MTKKDYIAMAEVIRTLRKQYKGRVSARGPCVAEVLQGVTVALEDLFQRDNPRFDRARFEAAIESDE